MRERPDPQSLAETTYAATLTSARRADVDGARRQAQRRCDDVAKTIIDGGVRLACSNGCAFCCHLRVGATAAEVLGLADFIGSTFDADQRSALLERLSANATRVRGLTRQAHAAAAIPCALLVQNRCSAYAARPLRCRQYHSLDVTACIELFSRPRPPVFDPLLIDCEDAILQGFQAGVHDAGLDSRIYELATALLEALTDDAARARYLRREQAFLQAPFEVLERG